jgi:hypothetical protein
MRTLLLTVEYPRRASYLDDWRDGFLACAALDVTVRNVFHRGARRQVRREIGEFDLIVVLHSANADTLSYVLPLAGALQARRGRLVSFVGNEVNLPWAPVGSKIAWLKAAAPDIIATQLLEEAGAWLYAETGARVISLPHALNPEAFYTTLDQGERAIDIGARSYRYLAYIGDDDRNRIYDYFLERRFAPALALDFSIEDRLDRAGWMRFLNRCKATIATEAGSWYLERDDRTVLEIRKEAAKRRTGLTIKPDSWLQHLARRLPYGMKARLQRMLGQGPIQYEAVSAEQFEFAEIHRRFFAGRARAPVYSKAISSRHFDAIGTKTLQILFPGRYNDILTAGEHYLALEHDFSNIDAVLAVLRDDGARRRIVDRAHDHVMSAHTYRHRIETLLSILGEGGAMPAAR